MKNSVLKKMVCMLGTVALTASMLGGCGSDQNANNTKSDANASRADNAQSSSSVVESTTASSESEQLAALSGSISMAGSTSMQKLATALAEAFMEKYPGVTVNAEFTGSSAGIEDLNNGVIDIGNSSRSLKDKEKEAGAVENIVAIDGIAVVVNKDSKVTDISKDALIQIYTGQITNWSDLGGDNEPVVVIGREAGSGTRGAFEELLKVEDQCTYANELDTTGAVIAKVASTPGAIGYASLDAVGDTVIAAKLDGVEPTEANIVAGNYALSRPFVMATKGEISAQNDLVRALFDYIYSDEGKNLVKSVGLVSVN